MDNKVKLKLMSKTDIQITDKQLSSLLSDFQKISALEERIKRAGLEITSNVLSLSLLEREGVDSSIIEGTQTNHDEIYFDISDGIRDRYSWEVRNLINLYKSSFTNFGNETLDYTIEDMTFLHRGLYSSEVKGYDAHFNPSEIIKKVKPGRLIEDDNKPNWIGPKGKGISEATLILIQPSKKREYLKDMFEEIRGSKGQKAIKTIIKFHPFFEAVHPFADGNGRLGRLLLVNIFSYFGVTKHNWIFMSDTWRKNRNKYIAEIAEVQKTNQWESWTSFFVESLSVTVENSANKLDAILELYLSIIKNMKMNDSDKHVLKYFFKYPILNKQKTIQNLIEKHKTPPAAAYRSFAKIAKALDASDGKNYRFESMIKIISQ